MSDFKNALEHIFKWEGRYTNDPCDPGRETYKGIARRFNPNWDGWKLLDRCQKNEKAIILDILSGVEQERLESMVRDFYRNQWDKFCIFDIENQMNANLIFNTIINMGIKRAVVMAQHALFTLGLDIKIDGILGPRTISLINEVDDIQFNQEFVIERCQTYLDLCKETPAKGRFLRGWISRVTDYLVIN
jgi:lysozyme family protein